MGHWSQQKSKNEREKEFLEEFPTLKYFYLHLVRLKDIYSLKQKDIPSDS